VPDPARFRSAAVVALQPRSDARKSDFVPRLTRDFFARPCLRVAPELVGCELVRRWPDGSLSVGRIVEVEAYLGDGSDPGSHSHRGQTPRNRSMFGPPGHLYAYRSYGIHVCVNLVCEPAGQAAGILLRAMEPLSGMEPMRRLRGLATASHDRMLARGPGRLAQALGLGLEHDGESAVGRGPLWLRTPLATTPRGVEVVSGPRVGLGAGEHLPYRFHLKGSPWVSPWRPGGRKRRGGSTGRPAP
jgi:DNA-3-methyladenine glycosylase